MHGKYKSEMIELFVPQNFDSLKVNLHSVVTFDKFKDIIVHLYVL